MKDADSCPLGRVDLVDGKHLVHGDNGRLAGRCIDDVKHGGDRPAQRFGFPRPAGSWIAEPEGVNIIGALQLFGAILKTERLPGQGNAP